MDGYGKRLPPANQLALHIPILQSTTPQEEQLITYLNSDPLIHFQLEPCECNEKHSLKEEMHLQTYVFITCDFLSIIKYGGEGQKTSTYAFITLLLPVNGENFYIYQAKVNQIVATKLAARKFNTNQ